MSIKNIFKQNFHNHPFSNRSAKVCPKCGCLMKLIPQTNTKSVIYQCPVCGGINPKRHFGLGDIL